MSCNATGQIRHFVFVAIFFTASSMIPIRKDLSARWLPSAQALPKFLKLGGKVFEPGGGFHRRTLVSILPVYAQCR
ncbi:hypothetical protein DOTSEDRAFT_75435 [Dothistroma septosporum NZE10]|uniref:Uncharacterized protein n=1 Tax=Dothistroma septosporum (strain NZE10 / CBS 128990) TaxID=675120 RepID=M2XGR9_DOTSN|nr:hypothetical protein DOTSEDRAFT_75435 [Dothistroma septosporum NZE10]